MAFWASGAKVPTGPKQGASIGVTGAVVSSVASCPASTPASGAPAGSPLELDVHAAAPAVARPRSATAVRRRGLTEGVSVREDHDEGVQELDDGGVLRRREGRDEGV